MTPAASTGVSAPSPAPSPAFERVAAVGLTLDGVELLTSWNGLPVLKVDGVFVAGLAAEPAAEPDTLVVRCALEERDYYVDEAPDTYYVTEYHRKHPVVLARIARLDEDTLRELLTASWRLALPKTRRARQPRPGSRSSRRRAR